MSNSPSKKHSGNNHTGSDSTAPYPVSRLSPSMELVDLARTISNADRAIVNNATGKLSVIARQIQSLQDEAHKILQQAQRDQKLHRAECNCQRIPGKTYHLYKKQDDKLYFSLLSPADWQEQPPHVHAGSYRLENDMSWTALDENQENKGNELLQTLLQELPDNARS